MPPASPLDRVKDGMMGSVQAAVDKAKEIAQRDRDPSVEWGDQGRKETTSRDMPPHGLNTRQRDGLE